MIKVMRIIARLNIGGPAIHTILLSSALNRDGDKDMLICGRADTSEGDMMYLARSKQVEPTVIPCLGRDISLVKDARAFLKLFALMKKERPHIVHTHTAKAGTLGRLAALFAGVPVKIHTFHGHIFDGYFSPAKARLFLAIETFLALFTDRIIAVSERVKDDIVNRLHVTSEAKCVVVPLGLDLARFLECERVKGTLRRELGIGDDTLLVAIVGRLVPIKNHRMFLDVARKVKEGLAGRRKVRFLIVGDGEMRAGLEEYARKQGLGDSVIFTGWIEDLAKVYADVDVVALTSLNEGTPVSLIEAMASGKAVITTDVGGVRDLVSGDETGCLIPRDDLEGFSKKLLELLDEKETRVRYGARGRESVRERYSYTRLVRDIKRLYEECVREKAGGRGDAANI